MVFRTAIALVLVAALPACAFDTHGHHSGNNNGRASRVDRAAFDGGYRDGYANGRHDARDGDRYNPKKYREYRSADNGRWGSRGRGKQEYRDGFLTGYEQGYLDGRGRGGRRGRP